MEKIISAIRRPEGPTVLISRPRYKFKLSLDKPAGNTPAQLNNFYEIIECPLEDVSNRLYECKERLSNSWRFLSSVKDFNAETLFHSLAVLIETQRDFDSAGLALPPLCFCAWRNDSADSSDYRNSAKRSTRRPRQSPLNLYACLCDGKGEKSVLRKLSSFLPSALELLKKAGYKTTAFSKLLGNEPNVVDPYYAYHHLSICGGDREKLPRAFAQYILPLLKGLSWRDVCKWLAVYWGLSLHKRRSLLLTIVRLLIISKNRSNIFNWCEIIAQQPQNRRAIFAVLLIKTRAYLCKAESLSPQVFERFNNCTPMSCYGNRLYYFLLGLKRGISADYMFAGFKLANRCHKHFSFTKLYDCLSFPLEKTEELVDYIETSESYYERLALDIWERCGELPGFSEIITSICWKEMPVEIAYKLLRLFIDLIHHDVSGNELIEKQQFVITQTGKIAALLSLTESDYRRKFIDELNDYLWHWDKVGELSEFLPAAFSILTRMCKPPFKKMSFAAEAISYFIDLAPAAIKERFLAAPDKSFLIMENVCRSSNAEKLITDGIEAMMKFLAEFTVYCFIIAPKRLFQVAKSLGCLKPSIRQWAIMSYKNRQKLKKDLAVIPLEEDADYCENELAALEKTVIAALKGIFHIADESFSVFSLLALQQMDSNARPFKRFLKAYYNGESDYILSHPASRLWMRKHKEIDVELWTQGIEYVYESEYYGRIRIEMEKDPLEALKLGEYVGSCLGLGGSFIYSAAAVVLDVNKQVLYARNSKNKVIARQVIAVSEENRLVCFEIYPNNDDKEIKTIFREYDVSFARALGIELYDESKNSEGYTVQNILSQEWWDDGAWDLTV